MTIHHSSENLKGNILLVDDIPENLQLLTDLLVKLGYKVRSVTSGRMALKTVKIKQPDLILLDIKMPEMNGYEVCQQLKADPDLQEIPVIFISALDDTFDKITAFRSGGVDYITKPFHAEEVVARLENQLTIQRQKHSLKDEITKRKATEEILYQSRALLSSVLNSSLDGIAAVQAVRDPISSDIKDFRYLIVNPVLAKIFGRTRESLIGKRKLRNLIRRIDPTLFERFIKVIETGEPLEDDLYYPLDEPHWYHFVAVKLGDGFAITLRDITDRKQFELQLQEANRKLELMANLDSLTQLANRRYFNNYLTRQWQEHLQSQKNLAVILLDIDYFKRYNDYYGLPMGDDCLIKIAQTITRVNQPPGNLVARYGSEQFGMILPYTNREEVLMIAEMLQSATLSLALPHVNSPVSEYITLSVGFTSLIPAEENSWEVLITQANKALDIAKNEGGNRVIDGTLLNF